MPATYLNSRRRSNPASPGRAGIGPAGQNTCAMKKLFPLIAVLATLCATAAQRPLQLIPQPVRAELREGHFAAPGCKVTAEGFASRPEGLIRVASALAAPHGKQPARKTRNTLLLQLDARAGIPAEGYRLRVAEHEAELTAGDESGIFYGLQTLLQMADADGNIPCAEIEDYPRYGYRGLHLDVCRHFFPVEFVKGYLDRMAAAKLNRFHWHLTDDQGWRIEIKRYPRLTQVGAWRSKSQIGSYEEKPATFEFGRYGGFYTQDEIREVVAYAAERHITVIPEIEMPGHSLAALTAYPWLGCVNNPESYEIAGWICGPGNVLCPGKESTFEFLENVLDEVLALFPSKLIHIGGDECQRTRWEACPDCQARIAAEGLHDETQLQSYLTHRIDSYLASKGRQLIGWDEIMEGGLSPGAVIMSWRGTQGGIAAAREYHHVVMTPGQYLYFDKRGTDSPDEPVSLNLSLPLEKIYGYDPAEGLSEEEQQYLLGVQANLWTEFVATEKRVEYQLLPRIYALSEIAWSPVARKSWEEFSRQRLPAYLARLDAEGAAYQVPQPHGIREETLEGGCFRFTIRPPFPGCRVYYTLNGATPYDFDREVPGELEVIVPRGEQRVLKCVAVTPAGRRSMVVTTRLGNPGE